MGLIDKLRTQYDLYKLNKYTRRRLEQSNFEFHDREYYEAVYCNGVYLDRDGHTDSAPASPRQASFSSTSSTSSRWSDILKRPASMRKRTTKSLAASQAKTSETYSFS